MGRQQLFAISVWLVISILLTSIVFMPQLTHTANAATADTTTAETTTNLNSIVAETQQANNFASSLHTFIKVNELGVAAIKHEITIKNLNPLAYATQFAWQINSPAISDIVTQVNGEDVTSNIVLTDRTASIGITMPQPVVGESKETIITINYTDPHASYVAGNLLTITFPKLIDANQFIKQDITLTTPIKFGNISSSSPTAQQVMTTNENIVTTFSNLQGSSLKAVFGTEQIFAFAVEYNLQNQASAPTFIQIPLPPDTKHQHVYFEKLEPQPNSWRVDADGNWLATYNLKAQSEQVVTAAGKVKLKANINENLSPMPTKSHLAALPFWQVGAAATTDVVGQATNVSDIYQQVISYFNYNFAAAAPARAGASAALTNPQHAQAIDIVDSVIAIWRQRGHPARSVIGYAYTPDTNYQPLAWETENLHFWAEVNDGQQWLTADPTWENITAVNQLQANSLHHITLATQGVSSTGPWVAPTNNNANPIPNIDIKLASNFQPPTATFSTQLNLDRSLAVPLPGVYQLSITNLSGNALYNLPIKAWGSNKLKISLPTTEINLLPYETTNIPFIAYSNQLLASQNEQVELQVSDETYHTSISSGPLPIFFLTKEGTVLAVGILSALGTITAGSLLVYWTRKRRPLRR